VPSRTFFFRPAHDDGWDDSDLDELARAALKAIREDGKLEERDAFWRKHVFQRCGVDMPLHLKEKEDPPLPHFAGG
jgi:hypothetical protein